MKINNIARGFILDITGPNIFPSMYGGKWNIYFICGNCKSSQLTHCNDYQNIAFCNKCGFKMS